MPSNNLAAQPTRGFSDRLQTYWDNPHPQGLVAMLKAALNGIGEAVQGSIAATTTPSTEQEAFWQNQGRDRGPIGALQAATLLTPLAPGAAGGRFAGPIVDALRNRPPSLAGGARILEKRAAGASIPSGETQAQVPYINEFLRYLHPTDHVATHAAIADTSDSAVRFVSRNTSRRSSLDSPDLANRTSARAGIGSRRLIPRQENGRSFGKGSAEQVPARIAPPLWLGVRRPVVPKGPVSLPPVPAGNPSGKSLSTTPSNKSVGNRARDKDCIKEIREARKICTDAFVNGWKSDYGVGPYEKEFGGPWTIKDCMRGFISQRCGGNRHDNWVAKKPNAKKRRRRKGR